MQAIFMQQSAQPGISDSTNGLPGIANQHMPLQDLMVFHKLARSLTSSLDLDAILRAILDQMERFVDVEFWALLLVDQEHQDLYYAAADGASVANLRDLRVKMGEGLAGWVARHGESLIIPEGVSDPRIAKSANGYTLTIRSAVGIPIRGRKGTHGVIEILNPTFDQDPYYTIAFLHILADYAAIAIENSEYIAHAQQLTITDDVTGLFNTRHLYAMLDRELVAARQSGRSLSLCFLDLDQFKLVNDFHGHLVGSELLGLFGKRIRELSRPTDFCFRYGGDEFVIMMPGAGRDEASHWTHSLHAKLTNSVFQLHSGLKLFMGSSVGIATYPDDGRSVHDILGAADRRMYEIKATGRGRVAG